MQRRTECLRAGHGGHPPPATNTAWPDFDGDGSADRAVFRPSSGGWHVHNGTTTRLGFSGGIPVPADYDGDGTWERAVYRPQYGGWYVDGQATVFDGLSTDVPLSLPNAIFRAL